MVELCISGSVGPTVGVGFDPSWDDDDSNDRYPFPEKYVTDEKEILSELRKPTRRLDKRLSFIPNNRSSSSTTVPLLRQTTLSEMQSPIGVSLYPGDTITTMRPTKSGWTDGVVCVLHTCLLYTSDAADD